MKSIDEVLMEMEKEDKFNPDKYDIRFEVRCVFQERDLEWEEKLNNLEDEFQSYRDSLHDAGD